MISESAWSVCKWAQLKCNANLWVLDMNCSRWDGLCHHLSLWCDYSHWLIYCITCTNRRIHFKLEEPSFQTNSHWCQLHSKCSHVRSKIYESIFFIKCNNKATFPPSLMFTNDCCISPPSGSQVCIYKEALIIKVYWRALWNNTVFSFASGTTLLTSMHILSIRYSLSPPSGLDSEAQHIFHVIPWPLLCNLLQKHIKVFFTIYFLLKQLYRNS